MPESLIHKDIDESPCQRSTLLLPPRSAPAPNLIWAGEVWTVVWHWQTLAGLAHPSKSSRFHIPLSQTRRRRGHWKYSTHIDSKLVGSYHIYIKIMHHSAEMIFCTSTRNKRSAESPRDKHTLYLKIPRYYAIHSRTSNLLSTVSTGTLGAGLKPMIAEGYYRKHAAAAENIYHVWNGEVGVGA